MKKTGECRLGDCDCPVTHNPVIFLRSTLDLPQNLVASSLHGVT